MNDVILADTFYNGCRETSVTVSSSCYFFSLKISKGNVFINQVNDTLQSNEQWFATEKEEAQSPNEVP